MTVFDSMYVLIDSIMFEVLLTTVVVILLGAAVYALFFCSMQDDRRDARRKFREKRTGNPWEKMITQEDTAPPVKHRKHIVVGLILLALAAAGIALLVLL